MGEPSSGTVARDHRRQPVHGPGHRRRGRPALGLAGLLRELGLCQGYAEFFWVSSPEATHSRNIAVRPQVGIAIFDSQVPIGTGQGVYLAAEAAEVTDAEVARGIEVFSRRSLAHGGVAWTPEDVGETTGIRLYRARAAEHSIQGRAARSPDPGRPRLVGPKAT